MRTKYIQLPNREELEEILKEEDKREISGDKKDIHYPDFSSIISLFNRLDIYFEYFEKDIPIKDFDDNLIREVEILLEKAVNKILKSQSRDFIKIYNQVYDYLSEEDIPQKSDFIFVFGSKLNLRIDKAIELYNQELSSKIIVSGGRPIYEKNKISEAENLKDYAISKGIPKENMIIETKSISMVDNIKRSLNLLEERNINYSSFMIVNSPFAQRRGWCYFKKFTPKNKKIYRVNANSLRISKDNWYKQEEAIKIILNEFIKMKMGNIFNCN